MIVNVDERIEKFIQKCSRVERARIARVVRSFQDNGFSLSEIYLKKLTKIVWELRAGNIRLLFGIINGEAIIVNVFFKKTAKTPLKEISLEAISKPQSLRHSGKPKARPESDPG